MVVKNFIINFELDNHVERDWVNDMNKCTRQEVVLLCAPKKNIISFCVTEKSFSIMCHCMRFSFPCVLLQSKNIL
jgi:hypothetical protein